MAVDQAGMWNSGTAESMHRRLQIRNDLGRTPADAGRWLIVAKERLSFHIWRTAASLRNGVRPEAAFNKAAAQYMPSVLYPAPPARCLRTSSIVWLPKTVPWKPVVGEWNSVPWRTVMALIRSIRPRDTGSATPKSGTPTGSGRAQCSPA